MPATATISPTTNGGDDYIDGGTGFDKLYGGAGSDHIVNSDSNDIISGGDGDDRIEIYGASNVVTADAGSDWIDVNGSYNTVNAGIGDDEIDAYGTGGDTLNGDDGNDAIFASGGANTLSGGGRDLLDGGTGDDFYILTYGSGHTIGLDISGHDSLILGPDVDVSDLLVTTLNGFTYYGLKDPFSSNADASQCTDYIFFAANTVEDKYTWDEFFGTSLTARASPVAATADGGQVSDMLNMPEAVITPYSPSPFSPSQTNAASSGPIRRLTRII
jgi:Ca2+-binding RTX toxin-like protein